MTPFVRVLAQRNQLPSAEVNELRGLSLDDRVPVSVAYRLLEGVVERTGDVDIGLKAGRSIDYDALGAFDYAVRSATTVSDAMEVAARYMRLLSDALDFRIEVVGDRAHMHLINKVPAPRGVIDFEASVLHNGHLKRHLHAIPNLEWSFTHPEPADVSEYALTFGGLPVKFSQPYVGYSFDKAYLEARRNTGDPRLHVLLRKHAELLLSELPKRTNFRETVRAMLVQDMETARPTAAVIAARLEMSQRTLSRRLEQEGTSFKDLLDDCRRTLALDCVTRPTFRLPEVVFLLGFSETATFYRAFKRWTGQTPLQYRRAHAPRQEADVSSEPELTPAR
jgi:AraC-like DNA-binding protein